MEIFLVPTVHEGSHYAANSEGFLHTAVCSTGDPPYLVWHCEGIQVVLSHTGVMAQRKAMSLSRPTTLVQAFFKFHIILLDSYFNNYWNGLS